MFRRILVPVDGSPFSEQALPHALGIARRGPVELHLFLVNHLPLGLDGGWLPQPDLYLRSMFESEEAYLHDLQRRLAAAGASNVTLHHDTGDPVELVSHQAGELEIDLIVMSTHGRGGFQRAYLGSVADGVVRRATAPVLLVRPEEDGRERPLTPVEVRRVLVALDGSAVAEGALSAALEVAAAENAQCTVMQVVVPPVFISSYVPDTSRITKEDLDAASAQAQQYLAKLEKKVPDVDGSRVVVHQQPAVAILKEADEIGADMIAVGTRGLGRIARLFIGSVADKVVRGADVPVLVVPGKPRRAKKHKEKDGAGGARVAAR